MAACADRCHYHQHDGTLQFPQPHLREVHSDVGDVIDALAKMFEMHFGQPITITTTQAEADVGALAEEIAENSGYDDEMFRGATRLGGQQTARCRDTADVCDLPDTDDPRGAGGV